jgi:hypothetical protein
VFGIEKLEDVVVRYEEDICRVMAYRLHPVGNPKRKV